MASRIFWGLFFLAGGAAIVLNQLGLFSFMDLSLGHVIWSILLIAVFIKSIASRFWVGTFLSLFFLFWVLSAAFGIAKDFSWWPIFGAAVFLSIGFTILFRPKKKDWYFFSSYDYKDFAGNDNACESERIRNSERVYAETVDENTSASQNNAGGNSENTAEGNNYSDRMSEGNASSGTSADESEVYARANFGSTIKYVNSKNFKRAFVNCSFGAAKMYFDNACIAGEEAEINIEASFCGIELFIPREWQVLDEMDHIMGGVEEKNPQRHSVNGPRVRLTGHMKFSGIEIIYV